MLGRSWGYDESMIKVLNRSFRLCRRGDGSLNLLKLFLFYYRKSKIYASDTINHHAEANELHL
jgi:hypothetical protein